MSLKSFVVLVVALCMFYSTHADVWQSLPDTSHPGKCWDGEHEYDVGTYYPEGKCQEVSCNSDFSMSGRGYVKNTLCFRFFFPLLCLHLVFLIIPVAAQLMLVMASI